MTGERKDLKGSCGSLFRQGLSSAWPGLALLLVLAFAPLLAGRNFLPFHRYNVYAMGLNGGEFVPFDGPFFQRWQLGGAIQEADMAPIVLFWPQELYTARSLRSGRLPLWDPYTGCGAPTLDSGQFRPLNPFRLPFYIDPTTWLWSATALLQLLAGGWGAWVWLVRRGFAGAALGAGCGLFVLNPWVLERLPYPDAAAYLVLPWCALALERCRWKGWSRMAAAALAFVLMGHVSHPEAALLMAVLAVGMAWETREERSPWRFALVLAAVGLLAAAAMAVLWVPPIRLFLNGYLYKAEGIAYAAYPWRNLFLPASDLFLWPAGAGLFAAGLIEKRGRPVSLVAPIGVSALALFAFPGAGYGVGQALQRAFFLPPYYFKATLWAGLSLFAAYGWQALSRPDRRLGKAASLLVSAAAFVAVLVLVRRLPENTDVQSAHFVLAAVLMAVSLAALAAGAVFERWRLQGAAVLLVLLPLAFPLALNQLDWNRIDLRESPWATWLRGQHPHDRIASLLDPWNPIPPNTGQAIGVRCSEAIQTLFPNLYHQLFYVERQAEFPTFVVYKEPDWARFNGLGASLLLAADGAKCDRSGAVFSEKGVAILPMPHATGRLYFAESVSPPTEAGDLVRRVTEGWSEAPLRAVVDKVPADFVPPGAAPRDASASFLEDSPDSVRVRAVTSAPALLVLKDTWYPGWEARLDGRTVPILRVNGCFRGVAVPQGTHEVLFTYRPHLTYAVFVASLVVTVLLAVCALAGLARSKEPMGKNGW